MKLEQHTTPITVQKIFEHYKAKRKNEHRPHLGGSQIGNECSRALWYQFLHAWTPRFEGRILRLFETGHRIKELEAKLAKAVDWRPIETAPTYEAVLICGGDVLYPCVASLNNGEWDAEAQGGILREDIAECPTHWMPLPAPPSQN